MSSYNVINHYTQKVPIKAWTTDVPVEVSATEQLMNTAQLPFIHKWIAVMPDVHLGIGATIGSVVPMKGAIVPAAVGVDIGCGMTAVCTTLHANDLPDNLHSIRDSIEQAVPHGRTNNGGAKDVGAWHEDNIPKSLIDLWIAKDGLGPKYHNLSTKNQAISVGDRACYQLGTLGTGNHFIEVCLDEDNNVWIMLHSGSRGVGNKIGSYFIDLAKKDMEQYFIHLPDNNLAYFPENTQHFSDYVAAVGWAQDYARANREVMMQNILNAIMRNPDLPSFAVHAGAVECHHNYVAYEKHYGENVWVTRKGAVRARLGDLGIIPGSMGARSYIVRGKGNPESFESCSHGAGRAMSRTEARKRFTVEDHIAATTGVECRVDASVLDETPGAYKDIDAVMAAQSDLVEILHTLKQVVCVKG